MGYVFVLGGARSGKSDLAVRLGLESGLPVTVIVTATAGDEEMAARIRGHRDARPADWKTIEAPLDLIGAVEAAAPGDFVIVDCLTLWVSNLLGAGGTQEVCAREADRTAEALVQRRGVVVSNEVGLGIVPANELARRFRDVLGGVNARFAACADRNILMVAGRAVELGAVDSLPGRP